VPTYFAVLLVIDGHVVVAEDGVQLEDERQGDETPQVTAVGQLFSGGDESVLVLVLIAEEEVEVGEKRFEGWRSVQTT